MVNDANPNSGIINWISSIPPAVTVLGYLSLLLFIGEIGQWMQTYWFPITRTFWQNTLGYLLDWQAPDSLKDYFTAIAMFFPLFLASILGVKTQKSETVPFRIATTILACAMVFVVANHTYEAFFIFIKESAIYLWDIYLYLLRPTHLFAIVPLFVLSFILFGIILIAQQVLGRTFWRKQTKQITRSWKPLLAAVVLLLLGVSGAYPFMQDLREGLTTGKFAFSRYSQTHIWILLYVILPCFFLLLISTGIINRLLASKKDLKSSSDQQSAQSPTKLNKVFDPAELEAMLTKLKAENNPDVDIADLERNLDAYKVQIRQKKIGDIFGILTWASLILVAMFYAAKNVGLVESILSTSIVSMVVIILLRAPRRLYSIFVIVIALVITGQIAAFVLSFKSWLETVPT